MSHRIPPTRRNLIPPPYSPQTTSSISTAALGHTSSSVSVTGTVIPATTAANSSQSPDVQIVSVLHHPISSGTIAGIVVGTIVFLILTTASATLCWRRRQRSSQIVIPELPDHQTHNDVKSNPAIWMPELDQEGAVYGPHELPGTPTPTAQSLRSLEATESQPAEERVSEMADPGSTPVSTMQPLQSLRATESQPAEERASEIPGPG